MACKQAACRGGLRNIMWQMGGTTRCNWRMSSIRPGLTSYLLQPAIFTTMDITTDGFGFMLAVGDLPGTLCLFPPSQMFGIQGCGAGPSMDYSSIPRRGTIYLGLLMEKRMISGTEETRRVSIKFHQAMWYLTIVVWDRS